MTLASMKDLGNIKVPEFTDEEKAEIQKRIAEFERDNAERRRLEACMRAGIPERYQGAVLTDKRLLDWLSRPNDGVVLTGSIGAGKTYTACALLREYMLANNCTGRFVSAKNYVDECFGTKQAMIDRFYTPRVLVLDDLGKEAANKFSVSCIFELIDKRYSTNRKTIITTNYTGKEIMERMTIDDDTVTAKAFMSRLKSYLPLNLVGEDRRLNESR